MPPKEHIFPVYLRKRTSVPRLRVTVIGGQPVLAQRVAGVGIVPMRLPNLTGGRFVGGIGAIGTFCAVTWV
jgi:hypothetical protein